MKSPICAMLLIMIAAVAEAQEPATRFRPTATACVELCRRAERTALEAAERVQLQQCALAGLCTQDSRGYTATEPEQRIRK